MSDEERAAEYADWYAETRSSFEPMKRGILILIAAVRAEEREACMALERGLLDCKRYADDHDDEWVPHRVDDALSEAAAIRARKP